ncbi:vomeronasal type-2 receptor 26-like [Protopterus annectens]|uniref:vomeronasal type-2 receptor 26-like n=1 Tax=Protopterus annectens TaxID=7888 RepID=UPI001CFB1423|nr:vomeronasal type-2 receptor 26-like [Protopterus annectens]
MEYQIVHDKLYQKMEDKAIVKQLIDSILQQVEGVLGNIKYIHEEGSKTLEEVVTRLMKGQKMDEVKLMKRDELAIDWHPNFNTYLAMKRVYVETMNVSNCWVPKSMCSEACHPGYRRVLRQEEPPCCFDCIPCSDGEISNASGMCICTKCPQDYWTNSAKIVCIKKYLEFLSYEDPLGISLAMTAVVSSLVPIVVLCIFIKHHNTPVVKANNREVSYFLLVTLTFCLLTALIFIGPPNNETCIFRQTAFGIFFSICVSSVLAKTITVVIAFNATKPGSHLKSLVGSKTSFYIIFCCFAFQFIICIIWLSISPPFSDTDKTLPEKILIQCNEGSIFMFYCMLGYLGILATISLIIAFLARNLPDGFNEARFITFSMIVFISVWLSFVPAYISTRGMYMVAVEVFAILSSSIGLLLCIFLPKCYIILIRPSKNTRGYIVRPQTTLFKA